MVSALCLYGFMLTMTGYGVRATSMFYTSFQLFFSSAKSNTVFLCQKCGQFSVSSFKGHFLFYLVLQSFKKYICVCNIKDFAATMFNIVLQRAIVLHRLKQKQIFDCMIRTIIIKDCKTIFV